MKSPRPLCLDPTVRRERPEVGVVEEMTGRVNWKKSPPSQGTLGPFCWNPYAPITSENPRSDKDNPLFLSSY